MRLQDKLVRAMDTADDADLQVTVADSLSADGWKVRLSDVTQIPAHHLRLTADEARALAAGLLEAAAEADARNA